ncbi:hypothetical protein [Bradyrhizobium guangdongense]|uniref:hypothetical protein n=1 Tax=Bradyrhizobium guangdongense TaxID=1325090 RepID=UPI00112EA2AE|nr:hypothetical protein [Bradyrhizobium guangdongense]
MHAISLLSRLLAVAGLLAFASAPATFAQDKSDADIARLSLDAYRQWSAISRGRTDFEISDPVRMPGLLGLAAEQGGCRYKEDIANFPVRFMKLEGRRLAFVFCPGVISSYQIFDLTDLRKPVLLALPFAVPPDGFGTATRPGSIRWVKEASVFESERGSDVLPSSRVRHTYRFGPNGFVVVRVEVQQDGVGGWTTIWEAQRWSPSPVNPN